MKRCLILAVLVALASHRVQAEEPNAPRDVEFMAEVDGTIPKYVEILPKGWTKEKSCDVLIVLHGYLSGGSVGGTSALIFAASHRAEYVISCRAAGQ